MSHLLHFLLRKTPAIVVLIGIFLSAGRLPAQVAITNDPPQYGPYNGVFLQGGDGLKTPLSEHDTVLRADSPWSLYFWVSRSRAQRSSPAWERQPRNIRGI